MNHAHLVQFLGVPTNLFRYCTECPCVSNCRYVLIFSLVVALYSQPRSCLPILSTSFLVSEYLQKEMGQLGFQSKNLVDQYLVLILISFQLSQFVWFLKQERQEADLHSRYQYFTPLHQQNQHH